MVRDFGLRCLLGSGEEHVHRGPHDHDSACPGVPHRVATGMCQEVCNVIITVDDNVQDLVHEAFLDDDRSAPPRGATLAEFGPDLAEFGPDLVLFWANGRHLSISGQLW